MKKIFDLTEINNSRCAPSLDSSEVKFKLAHRTKGWALCSNIMGIWFVDDFDTEDELIQRYEDLKKSEYWLQTSDVVVHHAIWDRTWTLDYMIVE